MPNHTSNHDCAGSSKCYKQAEDSHMCACCSFRYAKMLLEVVLLLMGLSYMVSPSSFVTNTASDSTWAEVEELFPRYKVKVPLPSPGTPCPPLKLPESQPIDSSAVRKAMFAPARNRRPVPHEMKPILLPTLPSPTIKLPSPPKSVQLLCHIDRIYVRVMKSLFTNPEAEKYLKVGTCPVNKNTPEHYYFLYPINSCNVQRHENENRVLYSNTLTYEPVSDELVIREIAFSVQLECRYNKHFRSYSVGYQPQVEAGTVFLSLHGGVSLTPVDDLWEPLATWQTYTFGQPMYFEARSPSSRNKKRLYFSKCYVTASSDPDTTPKFIVMDNYGCLVDGKISPHSKFHPTKDVNTLRFSVGAVMFKDVMSQPAEKREMFLHCEMHLGPEMPTLSAKACSYKADTEEWVELYGDDSLCACCDSSCPAPDPSDMEKMLLNIVVLLMGLSYMVSPSSFVTNTASDSTWAEVEELFPRYKVKVPLPSPGTPCPPLKLPESQPIDSSAVRKNMFAPAKNRRPVPHEMKPILLPTLPSPTIKLPSPPKSVQLLCHIDRIYVRVMKSLFTNPEAEKYLKVGTCPVNKNTPEHYYFLYPINSCNVQRHENENRVLYSNTLTYEPVSDELVIRELPFSVQLECRYNKHFRSYSIGYQPQVEAGTVLLSLQGVVSLTPVDENWKPLSMVQSHTVGQPVYFEAKAPDSLTGKRLYLNKCYITASPDPDATPKYTVIDNYGCMVDSKTSHHSKFYPSEYKTTLRFSVGAFMFKDMAAMPEDKIEMFIHCDLTVGKELPTPSIKSCSYDAQTAGWSELYENDSVCACCDASCPAPDPSVATKISSNSWMVERHNNDQPMKKSIKLPEEIMDRGGFEMFWDTFDEITT
ncbi:hypothetical protein QTP86_024374 [Hemibagrus guttatus]|nr:hypothetical protein QTP86_024374 [Hemibagrus guttatus]